MKYGVCHHYVGEQMLVCVTTMLVKKDRCVSPVCWWMKMIKIWSVSPLCWWENVGVRHHYVGEKVWCVSPVTGATEGEEAVVGGHKDDGETGATEEEAVVGGHEDYARREQQKKEKKQPKVVMKVMARQNCHHVKYGV